MKIPPGLHEIIDDSLEYTALSSQAKDRKPKKFI